MRGATRRNGSRSSQPAEVSHAIWGRAGHIPLGWRGFLKAWPCDAPNPKGIGSRASRCLTASRPPGFSDACRREAGLTARIPGERRPVVVSTSPRRRGRRGCAAGFQKRGVGRHDPARGLPASVPLHSERGRRPVAGAESSPCARRSPPPYPHCPIRLRALSRRMTSSSWTTESTGCAGGIPRAAVHRRRRPRHVPGRWGRHQPCRPRCRGRGVPPR